MGDLYVRHNNAWAHPTKVYVRQDSAWVPVSYIRKISGGSTIGPVYPPMPPTNVRATSGSGTTYTSTTIEWDAPVDSPRVFRYTVNQYKWTGTYPNLVRIGTPNATQTIFAPNLTATFSATPDTYYSYEVISVGINPMNLTSAASTPLKWKTGHAATYKTVYDYGWLPAVSGTPTNWSASSEVGWNAAGPPSNAIDGSTGVSGSVWKTAYEPQAVTIGDFIFGGNTTYWPHLILRPNERSYVTDVAIEYIAVRGLWDFGGFGVYRSRGNQTIAININSAAHAAEQMGFVSDFLNNTQAWDVGNIYWLGAAFPDRDMSTSDTIEIEVRNFAVSSGGSGQLPPTAGMVTNVSVTRNPWGITGSHLEVDIAQLNSAVWT